MDWKKIIKMYPNVWNVLVFPDDSLKDNRWLYDFFDKHNIIIETHWHFPDFDCTIWDGTHVEWTQQHENRIDAENEAFEIAFGMLEKKLERKFPDAITMKDLEDADNTIVKTKKHGSRKS